MGSPDSDVPRDGWWLRALGWLAGSWSTALASTLGWSVYHSLVQAPAGTRVGEPFAYFAPYVAAYAAMALAPVAAPMLLWAYFAPLLAALEGGWAGVAVGAAGLAVPATSVLVLQLGPGFAPWAVWLVVWLWLLMPRVLFPALHPGRLGRVVPAA